MEEEKIVKNKLNIKKIVIITTILIGIFILFFAFI